MLQTLYNNFRLFLVTVEDCKLLENMNHITKEKYSQMNQMSQRIMGEISKLQNTCIQYSFRYNILLNIILLDDQFDQFITQVDDIHQQSIKMENTIKALDEYSKHLGIFNLVSYLLISNEMLRKQAISKLLCQYIQINPYKESIKITCLHSISCQKILQFRQMSFMATSQKLILSMS